MIQCNTIKAAYMSFWWQGKCWITFIFPSFNNNLLGSVTTRFHVTITVNLSSVNITEHCAFPRGFTQKLDRIIWHHILALLSKGTILAGTRTSYHVISKRWPKLESSIRNVILALWTSPCDLDLQNFNFSDS